MAENLEELGKKTCEVLEIMRKNKLSCKPIKCQFKQTSIKYLRTILSSGQSAINPIKVKAIADWPISRDLKDVQSFLGMCNFWWKFIYDFSMITCPLHDLI
jgi:hypothetical protein